LTLIALEPLLYYLHEHSAGSWSQFKTAGSSLNPDVDVFSVARGLSEHGLVEFLWDGNRYWSVTPAAAVACNRSGGSVALWGGTHRAADRIIDAGISCNVGERHIVRAEATYTYRQAIRIDPSKMAQLKLHVPILNSSEILETIPSLGDLFARCPEAAAPSSNASTFRHVYGFGAASSDVPMPFVAENHSLWRVGSRRFLYVSNGRIRFVPKWLGQWHLYADERRETYGAHYVREGGVFTLPFAPVLPAPYARALLVNEATEVRSSQFGTRCFSNVNESVATNICSKLSVDMEIAERRPRETTR